MTKSIVHTVCEQWGITEEEFFGYSRQQNLCQARRYAIMQLQAAGLSFRGIAVAMRRNYSTIQYWMHPEYQERRKIYYKKYHAEHPAPRTRKIASVKRKKLIEVYLTQGVHAAKPLAIEYGINPNTISRYARELGIKSKPGRPKMEAQL